MRKNIPFRSILFLFFIIFSASSLWAQTLRLDSLLAVVKTMKEDTNKANTFYEISRAYLNELNNVKKVAEYGWKELALSQKLNFKKGMANSMLNIGIFYRMSGNYDMALYYDNKSLVLMQETSNKKGESSALLNIGLNYSEKGNYKEALDYMKKGVQLKQQIGDRKGMAGGFNNLANVFQTQGNYTEALKYHLKSLQIKEEIDDKLGIALSYNNIGNVLYSQLKYDEALGYYLKAANYQESISNYQGIGNAYNNIGNVYSEKKKFKEALDYHLKALKAREKAEDKIGIARSCNNIGTIYRKLNKLETALLYQIKSYKLYKQLGDKKGEAEACEGLAILYDFAKDYASALKYYKEMLSINERLNFKEGIRDAYSGLAKIYEEQKQFDAALKYTELYTAVKDSLLNKENFKQVKELNTRYETDKKEKEILLLTKDQQLNAKIIKQQQLVRWGLIGGLALLSVSIFSIYRRYRFKQKANVILEKQKEEIQLKNVLITDSIDYAQTIQEAVLPTRQEIQEMIPDSFVLYKPKATVSGDFYWLGQVNERLVCAVADCTGHGVPGAFMSLLGYNMLENAVKDLQTAKPAHILDTLNEEVNHRLAGGELGEDSKHGMDISLISIDTKTNLLEFAGAHNSIYIVRANELIELKADKMGIGGNKLNEAGFKNQETTLQKGDMIYLFTDGFPDQIGGPNRKKFYYRPFKELLLEISTLQPEEQRKKLNDTHLTWMGEKMDQTDDILIMGIRIN